MVAGNTSHQTYGTEAKDDWTPPSLMRTAMFLLTLFGFWIYGPIGVFGSLVSALAAIGGGHGSYMPIAWVFRITTALLVTHAVYAFVTSPWKTHRPGYVGYVVNCVALTIGELLLISLGMSDPEVFRAAFGYGQ